MKKKFIIIVLLISLISGMVYYMYDNHQLDMLLPKNLNVGKIELHPIYEPITVSIKDNVSAYAMDLETGYEYFKQDENKQRYTASTIKILTALVAIDYYKDLNKKITAKSIETIPDQQFIKTQPVYNGEEFRVIDVLHGMLMRSSNEMALTLAMNYKGGYNAFIKAMNKKAKSLGCQHVEVTNPHGLSYVERGWTPESMSVKDMGLIAKAFFKNDTLMKILETKSYTMKKTNMNKERKIYSLPVIRESSKVYDERVYGAKSGYTVLAQRTLVTFAHIRNRDIVIVIFNEDTSYHAYLDTKNILDTLEKSGNF